MFGKNKINVEVIDLQNQLIVKYADFKKSYILTQFGGRSCVKLHAQLVKYGSSMFGGILAGVMNDVEGETEEEKLDVVSGMIAGALQGAFESIDDPEFLEFFFSLFASVTADGKVIDFDTEFNGENLVVAFDLAKQIIMYNCKPVFQQLGIAALLKPKAQKESEDRG